MLTFQPHPTPSYSTQSQTAPCMHPSVHYTQSIPKSYPVLSYPTSIPTLPSTEKGKMEACTKVMQGRKKILEGVLYGSVRGRGSLSKHVQPGTVLVYFYIFIIQLIVMTTSLRHLHDSGNFYDAHALFDMWTHIKRDYFLLHWWTLLGLYYFQLRPIGKGDSLAVKSANTCNNPSLDTFRHPSKAWAVNLYYHI